jgi:hypothetical protein
MIVGYCYPFMEVQKQPKSGGAVRQALFVFNFSKVHIFISRRRDKESPGTVEFHHGIGTPPLDAGGDGNGQRSSFFLYCY